MNFILNFFLRDIEGIIKFFQGLEARLSTFAEGEKAKAAQIKVEIDDLVGEMEQKVNNASLAEALRDKLKV